MRPKRKVGGSSGDEIMIEEIPLDTLLVLFGDWLKVHSIEKDVLIELHATTPQKINQLESGPRDILLDNARELMKERLQFILAMDTKSRLCRMQKEIHKHKNSDDPKYKEFVDLCKKLDRIFIQISLMYDNFEQLLAKALTTAEYEGIRHDVIDDALLAGKKTRGEV